MFQSFVYGSISNFQQHSGGRIIKGSKLGRNSLSREPRRLAIGDWAWLVRSLGLVCSVLQGTIYRHIIYPPNLGLGITVPGRKGEQGRFRGSSKKTDFIIRINS